MQNINEGRLALGEVTNGERNARFRGLCRYFGV